MINLHYHFQKKPLCTHIFLSFCLNFELIGFNGGRILKGEFFFHGNVYNFHSTKVAGQHSSHNRKRSIFTNMKAIETISLGKSTTGRQIPTSFVPACFHLFDSADFSIGSMKALHGIEAMACGVTEESSSDLVESVDAQFT